MFPPKVMKLKTGRTNNHISQIFFILTAPIYWWKMVSCTYTTGVMLTAAIALFDRPVTIDLAGGSGKGNIINTRWRQD
jgi:hypothetical protein